MCAARRRNSRRPGTTPVRPTCSPACAPTGTSASRVWCAPITCRPSKATATSTRVIRHSAACMPSATFAASARPRTQRLGMHLKPSREDLIELTRLNPFERFSDGRPRVPADLLARMKLVTTEEAWGGLRSHGRHRQFEGNWLETHPGRVTVGRAVTAQFVPQRPDYHDAIQQAGVAEGRSSVGGQNSWIIETLELDDVMVVDIFGKVKDGTIVGDNLGTAVRTRTRAGAVIHGGIRDLQGLVK